MACASIKVTAPPAPLPTSAPSDQFSARRAARHVAALATEPRYPGSGGHARAREYLLAELAALGLSAETQRAAVLHVAESGLIVGAEVRNLLARRPGRQSGRALALVSHYDSRPTTPGAGDDASGVAVILEILRALDSEPLQNDLLVLFTDAEELGLLGARAFVDRHPWAEEVALVVNLEARGNRGMAPMFETGGSAGWLIRELGRAAPYPYANSLSDEIYRRMPNDTDFSVFRSAAIGGLNFAFIGGHAAYHSRLDTPERLDLRALQHEGSNVLALVRRLGGLDLESWGGREAVYFNPWGWWLVTYPRRWSLPLALLGVLSTAGALVLGLARRRLSPRQILSGLQALALCLAAAPLLAWCVWYLLSALFPSLRQTPHGVPYDQDLCALVFVLLGAAVAAYAGARFAARPAGVAAGVLSAWAVLSVLSVLGLPGGSHLFVWPTLAGAVALALVFSDRRPGSRGRLAALWSLAALAGVLLVAPPARLAFQALTVDKGALVMLLVALPLSLALPLLAGLGERRAGWLSGISCLLALGLLAAVILRRDFGPDRPRANSLFYALDHDRGEAIWGSFDSELDAWTQEYLGREAEPQPAPEILHLTGTELLQAPAPLLGEPPPTLEVVAEERSRGRLVEVRVTSPRGAPFLRLHATASVPIVALRLGDQRLETGNSGGPLRILVAGLPEVGVRMGFELPDVWPVELGVSDQSFGLPKIPGAAFPARPDWLIPAPGWLSHATLIHKSFLF